MEENQQKQPKRSENMKPRELVCGDTVHVRNHLYGQVKWEPGTVVRRLGPLTYLIQVPYHNIPSVGPNSVPNPIVTPNIENSESSTVEQGIPKI